MKGSPPNGWNEWSRHVLAELVRLDEFCKETREEVNDLRTQVATLKVKAGLWGAAGAGVAGIGYLILNK